MRIIHKCEAERRDRNGGNRLLRRLRTWGLAAIGLWSLLMVAPEGQAEPQAGPRTGQEAVEVSALPLIELPAAAQNDVLAVILSGDGGWADLDKSFGEAFQKRGIATVGFDCLKYFWKERDPAEVSQALAAVLRHYLQAWEKKRVLLVGFSFGACWLPFLVNRLPGDLLDRVDYCVLLGPGTFVNVEIHLMDWMKDERRPGALEVLPEAARIKGPVLCVYGTEETDVICPALKGGNFSILPMPGGHHYNYRYDPVIQAIFKGLETVQQQKPPVR